ncbi:MAG TPA: prolyl oligopeptidase family serine peptidase [Terriglobales bacterium]|nr:prolyl oligopeptidase family serine peptidase [Terriglobales bacterium]
MPPTAPPPWTGGTPRTTAVTWLTGKLLPDTIDRTRAASLAWKHDHSGFYYTRYPAKREVPDGEEAYHRHVFYHALGAEPAYDPLVFAAHNPQDWPNVDLSEDGRWLLITLEQGWTRTELYVADLERGTPLTLVTQGKDCVYRGEIFRRHLYILSNEDAPRYRVFKASALEPARESWHEVIPQSDAVLQTVDIIGGRLFALYERNATSQIRIFSTNGDFLRDVKLPGLGTVTGFGGEWHSREMFFGFQSFTVPSSTYCLDLSAETPQLPKCKIFEEGSAAELKVRATQNPNSSFPPTENHESRDARSDFPAPALWARIEAPSIHPADYEVKQVWYASKDGTRVPMFLFHKKDLAPDGSNPTLLTGYGGFNISPTPTFTGDRFLWLERGGIFAVANLRGGGEFGEEWHRAGMLDKKQNTFDDFLAAAEYLIAQNYTDREHLAIRGGSNGGLLMGAAFTQRPQLFRAVVCQVPLLDMLRYQNFQIARLWVPEYGSADDPRQFEWLYAYSPYHHVKRGTQYPAILFMTAESDTRVDPMHAKKMAALLQQEAAHREDRPILLRIEAKAGHGAGKPITKLVDELTDVYSFLWAMVGRDC